MSNYPGLGVMIHYLSGGSEHAPSEYAGRLITGAELKDDKLRLAFADGTQIAIFDDGQSCCESRYMRTDDDVRSLIGHRLRDIEIKEGPDEEGEYGEMHEVCFLEVSTDGGFITLSNHNEHNGYYGGFGLTITEEKAPPKPSEVA